MEAPRGLTRCRLSFWLALTFDVAGLSLLLSGVFLDVFFSDVLIYAGGVGIFFSLLWWVFWYVGNLEVSPEELQDDVGLDGRVKERRRGWARLVRSLSVRFSGTLAAFPGGSASVVASRKMTNPALGSPIPSTQEMPHT